ncbi:MazG nucleotide pyrophosphohydrolase domain-containing protein [Actinopolymorpha singaporensis]|uniref:MazG nucleotide pyrophosphohydrolase domain-containing protein n=1 Tax=Actinopolymorpha singaporensis TaxID=117157 RepID=UPI0024110680|nr:MazG nucleotide pyrophosphohydrolase domain-containing protein [Actinopolymorpha singaporensis]
MRDQTHRSLVRYLVEESYETVEAIETGGRQHLREELGDLLFQVVFHAGWPRRTRRRRSPSTTSPPTWWRS